jgi:hypothetical protein
VASSEGQNYPWLGSRYVGQKEETFTQNLRRLNKAGNRRNNWQTLKFQCQGSLAFLFLPLRKDENQLTNQIFSPTQICHFLWAYSHELQGRTISQRSLKKNPFPKSNDPHNKESILISGINFSCCNFIPFSPKIVQIIEK